MRIVTVTIDENGDQVFLKGPASAVFGDIGPCEPRRASHVVPESLLLRAAFKALRAVVSDTGRLAAWSRTWECYWIVDARPAGADIIRWRDLPHNVPMEFGDTPWDDDEPALFWDRERAIAAEIEYLNKFFLEGK